MDTFWYWIIGAFVFSIIATFGPLIFCRGKKSNKKGHLNTICLTGVFLLVVGLLSQILNFFGIYCLPEIMSSIMIVIGMVVIFTGVELKRLEKELRRK